MITADYLPAANLLIELPLRTRLIEQRARYVALRIAGDAIELPGRRLLLLPPRLLLAFPPRQLRGARRLLRGVVALLGSTFVGAAFAGSTVLGPALAGATLR